MLKPADWRAGAIALGDKAMRSDVGAKALKGARQGLLPEQTQQQTGDGWWDKAKSFGAQAVSGVTQVGQKGLQQGAAAVKSMSDSGQQALSTVVGLPSERPGPCAGPGRSDGGHTRAVSDTGVGEQGI
jgi:hypothetical protein